MTGDVVEIASKSEKKKIGTKIEPKTKSVLKPEIFDRLILPLFIINRHSFYTYTKSKTCFQHPC